MPQRGCRFKVRAPNRTHSNRTLQDNLRAQRIEPQACRHLRQRGRGDLKRTPRLNARTNLRLEHRRPNRHHLLVLNLLQVRSHLPEFSVTGLHQLGGVLSLELLERLHKIGF